MTWKFTDLPNVAVITHQQIIAGDDWIAQVSHDADDGQWIFYSSGDLDEGNVAIVGLNEIIELDASIEDLACLPLGWHAWRELSSAPWQRARMETVTAN